jgi:hypothetical protein
MDYLLVIILILVFLVILNNYIINGDQKMYSLNGDIINMNNEIGFVKPEHRLLKILSNISSGSKIKLEGNCNQFIDNKNTITKDLNDKLIFLLKDVINSVNEISKNDYFIKKIENVYSMIDKKQNQRYIIDFFIYDTKNYYSIRLISDIVLIDSDVYINYLNIQSGSNSTLLDKYDIKYESSGILFNSEMFHDNLSNIFDNYYKNNFKVIGVTDTNLEYNNEDLSSVYTLNSLKNVYFPSSISSSSISELEKKDLSSYLEMYLPQNQNKINSPSFCNKYKIEWDKYGIPNDKQMNDDNCYVNNNQTTNEINQPWFGPGVIHERTSNNEYNWLKDPAIGNIIRTHGYRV